MDLNTAGTKLGIAALKKAFKAIKGQLSKRQQKKLICSAISELLQLDPDMDAAEAALVAAEVTRVQPSPTLFRARSMLKRAKSYEKAKRVARTRAVARKTTLKRRTRRKTTLKRRTARKTTVKRRTTRKTTAK